MTLAPAVFIRRFLPHVRPKGLANPTPYSSVPRRTR